MMCPFCQKTFDDGGCDCKGMIDVPQYTKRTSGTVHESPVDLYWVSMAVPSRPLGVVILRGPVADVADRGYLLLPEELRDGLGPIQGMVMACPDHPLAIAEISILEVGKFYTAEEMAELGWKADGNVDPKVPKLI